MFFLTHEKTKKENNVFFPELYKKLNLGFKRRDSLILNMAPAGNNQPEHQDSKVHQVRKLFAFHWFLHFICILSQ